METIYLDKAQKLTTPSVATIGMFDGVHRGHQQLIGKVVETAQASGHLPTVITFGRSPRAVLDPTFVPQLLTTLEEKSAIIGTLGVERLVVLPFSRDMAALSAQAFMQEVLQGQLGVAQLITGYDNRFGRNRAEGFDDYVRYGRDMGMTVMRGDVRLMADGSRPVSSSAIRELIGQEGKVGMASDCLGRCYQLRGTVEAGEHIGHRLGFPTANLHPDDPQKLIPATGVYAVWVTVSGESRRRAAMMNIGTRPTFDGKSRTLEVNVFGFDGNLYGQDMEVVFVERLREERRFGSPADLVAQLKQDQAAAMRILAAR